MVSEVGNAKGIEIWQTILRSVFGTVQGTTFTDTATLQSKLFALDVFLRSPMLQRLLVTCVLLTMLWCTPCIQHQSLYRFIAYNARQPQQVL